MLKLSLRLLVALIVGVAVVLIGYALLAGPITDWLAKRDMAALRDELKVGMSREAVYSIVRSHHQTAKCWECLNWTKRPDGVWQSLNDVNWPPTHYRYTDRNGREASEDNPEIYVEYWLGRNFVCVSRADVRVSFDTTDRVNGVTTTPIMRTCL